MYFFVLSYSTFIFVESSLKLNAYFQIKKAFRIKMTEAMVTDSSSPAINGEFLLIYLQFMFVYREKNLCFSSAYVLVCIN